MRVRAKHPHLKQTLKMPECLKRADRFTERCIPPDPLLRYMDLMSVNSRGRLLDLKDLNALLPLATPPQGSLPVGDTETAMLPAIIVENRTK
eukprot:8461072-Pyramimonas_sp.AAC.1